MNDDIYPRLAVVENEIKNHQMHIDRLSLAIDKLTATIEKNTDAVTGLKLGNAERTGAEKIKIAIMAAGGTAFISLFPEIVNALKNIGSHK